MRTSRGMSRDKRIRLLAERDGSGCFYCKKALLDSDITFDHYIPRSAGGSWELSNLRLACQPCNNRKGDSVPDENGVFIRKPREMTRRETWQLRKSKRELRNSICHNCDNGRKVQAGDQCRECGFPPGPDYRPHYLKRRTWECDHLEHWCIACALYTDDERLAGVLTR